MRKIHLISAAVLAMAMTACSTKELDINDVTLGENDFGFSIEKIPSTRVSVEAPAPVVFELGNSGFYLTETVTELDYAQPATKGTPIYTENIDKYYPSISVVGYKVGGEDPFVADASYSFMKPTGAGTSLRKVYQHYYANDIWPEEGTAQEMYFFLRAPADYIASKTENLEYNSSTGAIEFDYTSAYTGEAQQDMLFTSRTLTKEEYIQNYIKSGAPATFYHALTGVKFRVGSQNEGTTKTIITGVKFSGLMDKGHCVITPTEGKASKENVVWDPDQLHMDLGTFTQGFANPAYSETSDNSIDLTGNANFAGTSLVDAAADKQLNNGDGSLTFWFIPQEISEEVTLEVTFRVKTPDTPNGTEITHSINFGEQLVAAGGVTWLPGQLRTYTLDPKDVDVEIFDKMSDLTKYDLHVTNTGNVDEYVRMMLIGNWYGWLPDEDPSKVEPSILVGYKYKDAADAAQHGGKVDDMVAAWYREDAPFSTGFDKDETTKTFEGGRPSGTNKWRRGTGSYFYYPDVIGAGDKLSASTALFQSYVLDESWIPTIYIPVGGVRKAAKGVHLVMECVIQAIGAKKPDGSYYETWEEAWSAATGEKIEDKDSRPKPTTTGGDSGETGTGN